jgi:hypothetical protein
MRSRETLAMKKVKLIKKDDKRAGLCRDARAMLMRVTFQVEDMMRDGTDGDLHSVIYVLQGVEAILMHPERRR